MRSSLLLAAMLPLMAVDVAHAGEVPPKPVMAPRLPAFNLSTKVFDFPTGLRIMFQSDRSYPVVSVYGIVAHGSADDPSDKKEVAHFVEHTWFRSQHGSLPPIMQVVNDLSGYFNASTWSDWTNYSTVADSKYLPILLRLESLRLTEFYAGVTEDVTTTEREVIRNEWRRRNENNYALLFDYASNVVFPENHPYHSTSTHETITNITLDDIKSYVDKYYVPEDTTIIVVGDVDPAEYASLIFQNFDLKILDPNLTPEMVFKYPRPGVTNPDKANPDHWLFGAWDPAAYAKGEKKIYQFPATANRAARVTPIPDEPPAVGTREVVTREAPVEKPIVILAWSLPGGYRASSVELQALGQFASGIVGSGLSQVYSSNEVSPEGCNVQQEILASTLLCFAEVKSSRVNKEEVIEKMLDQVSTLWTTDEVVRMSLNNGLQNVKNSLMASTLLTLDNIVSIFGGRADSVGTYAHLTGSPDYYGDSMAQLGGISLQRMIDLASKYLKRDRAGRVIVNPLPDDEVDKSNSSSSYVGASQADDVIRASDDLLKVTPQQIRDAYIHPDVTKLVETTLPNGLRVVIAPYGEAPLASASLILGGGTLAEGKAITDLVATFTAGAGVDPTTAAVEMSFPVYSPSLYGLVAETPSQSYPLAGTIGATTTRLSFSGPSGNLDSGLWVLRSEVEQMHANMDGLGEWKKDFRDAVTNAWKDKKANVEWHVSDLVSKHLYPGTPARHSFGWSDYQEALGYSSDTVTKYLASHLNPENAVLVIVGNVPADQAQKLATDMFGSWEGRSESASWLAAAPAPAMPTEGLKVYLFQEPQATQSQTNMMCRLNYGGHEDDAVVDVIGSIAGDRAFTTLRVKEALSYTPTAYASASVDGAAVLTFDSLALNIGVGRTIQYFMETAASLERGDIKPEEVTLHQLRSARQTGLGAQSIAQFSGTLARAVANNDPTWKSITGYGDALASVNKDRIAELMKGCSEHAIIVTRGPTDVIAPQLDKLGIAYEIVDWKARGASLWQAVDPKGYDKWKKAKDKAEAKKAAADAKKKEKEKSETPTP